MKQFDPVLRVDQLSQRTMILIGVSVTPLIFVFGYLGELGRGRVALVSAASIVLSARLFWTFRKQTWYWVIALCLFVIHIPLVVMVHWSDTSYPGIVLLPLAVPDFALVWCSFKFGQRIFAARNDQR